MSEFTPEDAQAIIDLVEAQISTAIENLAANFMGALQLRDQQISEWSNEVAEAIGAILAHLGLGEEDAVEEVEAQAPPVKRRLVDSSDGAATAESAGDSDDDHS